jgi:hypothetical protein
MMNIKNILTLTIICTWCYAGEIQYQGVEGGSYTESANWSSAIIPGVYDIPVVDNGREVVLNDAGANLECDQLKIGGTNAVSTSLHRFRIEAGSLTVDGQYSGVNAMVLVGSCCNAGADGALTMNGGTLTCYHLAIGYGARGVVYMNGGVINSAWSVDVGGFPWGTNGQAGILMLNGGTIKTDQLMIYNTGSVVVSDGVIEISSTAESTIQSYVSKGLLVPAYGYKLVICDFNYGYGVRISAQKIETAEMFTPGYGFKSTDKIVSTVIFSWYDWPPTWQNSGPWLPLEGRENWTGESSWWKEQIKQVMAANIDYMWFMNWYNNPLFNLFGAFYELRMEGYDVPKFAPYFDTMTTYSASSVNLSTTAGKDEFVSHYIDMYKSYFLANSDPNADKYIARIDNKVILCMYSIPSSVTNISSLTRSDVESRLAAAFGAKHPVFNNGVYFIRAYDSGVSWANEKVKQFCGGTYLDVQNYNGVKSARIQPGYWDQNIRNPGLFLPRNGGSNYINAWNSVLADSTVNHVNVESFNEYDEGSGIYAVDVVNSPDLESWITNNDVWSNTNDPFEYIKTTAAKAKEFNSRPALDANIIWHNIPATVKKGQTIPVTICVRNNGDTMWSGAEGYGLSVKSGTSYCSPAKSMINDSENQIGFFGGVFRGRPVKFNFTLAVPSTAGTYTLHFQMQQGNTWFGQDFAVTINVACSVADFNGDCKVDWHDLTIMAGNWLEEI